MLNRVQVETPYKENTKNSRTQEGNKKRRVAGVKKVCGKKKTIN